MRTKISTITLLFEILSILVPSVVIGESPWPMYMHDAKRTRQSTYSGPEEYNLKWIFDGADGFLVLGADGTIYARKTVPTELYAINPDGTFGWSYKVNFYQPPSVGPEGTLYVPNHGGHYLYALNPDGSRKWTFYTPKYIDCSPALADDGTIYLGTDDDVLHALNPDGSLKWTFYFQESGAAAKYPSLAGDGTIYMSNYPSKFYAINSNGTLRWSLDITAAGIGVVGPSETIYVCGGTPWQKDLYALNPDGTTKWIKAFGDRLRVLGVSRHESVYVGNIYASQSTILAVNEEGGLNWDYTTEGSIVNTAIDAEGRIYFVANYPYAEPYGIISCITPTGSTLWTATLDDAGLFDVVIGRNETIYVSSSGNKIYAIGGEEPPEEPPGGPADVWKSAHPENYRVSDRENTYDIKYIVIHTTEGTYQNTIDWFGKAHDPDPPTSAHYVINKEGTEITQMVLDKDIAYHAGNWGYNTLSIGIEHEGYANDPDWIFSQNMYEKSASLVRWLCDQYDIPQDRAHIIEHSRIVSTRFDPGRYWDWNYYMDLIRGTKGITVKVYSPVDIVIVDPDGLSISKESNGIVDALYIEADFDGDGEYDDEINIAERKKGDYSITIIAEPDALSTETFTLEVTAEQITEILAENVTIDDIPTQSYIIRSTATDIMPIIPATINFDPDTLNLKSEGEWITVYIELPVGHGYDVSDINVGRTFLEGLLEVKHSDIQDSVLMVKFDMQDLIIFLEFVIGVIPPEEIPMTVTGELKDGRRFEGGDTVRVIEGGNK